MKRGLKIVKLMPGRGSALTPQRSVLIVLLLFALTFQSVMPIALAANRNIPSGRTEKRERDVKKLKTPKGKNGVATTQQPTNTITVFGPHRYDQVGLISQSTDQFSLPPDAIAPFAIQIQNGAADGSGRVLFATIRLNGSVLFGPGDIHLGVPSVSGPVTLTTNNKLEVQFFGRQHSFLTITFTATSNNPLRPVITDFNPKRGDIGTTVTLTGTNLTAATGATTVTFAGSNNTRVPAVVASSSSTQVLTTVPSNSVTGTIELTNANGLAATTGVFTVESPQNFQLTVAPSVASVPQRGTATYIVSVTSQQSTFTQLASLSASGLPAGVKATFVPAQITAGATSTLSVSLNDVDLSPGSFTFSISGRAAVEGQDLIRTANNITLNVLAAGQTTLSGRVLSTHNEPIIGATASLDGKTATTDASGSFILSGITAGTARPVMIDGRTASAPNRTYPVITEPATVVASQANVLPFTFYLPPIDTQHEVEVVPGQDTVVGNPRLEGLAMTVPAGANLRNRDGSPVARVSITPLDIDRTPAPLPSNVGTSMVYTSQPGGAIANIAMPVVYPNLAGADPGTRMELYAFNHDTVQWYVYGFGRVSSDGRTIAPEIDPATGRPYGLRDFSWHFPNVAIGGNPGDDKGGCGCESGSSNRRCKAVDLSTGVKIEKTTDISFDGARGGLELTRVYTSDLAQTCDSCPFGRGTTHNYAVRLTGLFQPIIAGRVVLPEQVTGRALSLTRIDPDGATVFTISGIVSQIGDVVRKLTDGTFEYRYRDGRVMRFDSTGRLTSMIDRNGNTTMLSYTGSNLTRITDAVGRSITLDYDGANRITRATDPLGRSWQYAYSGGLLASVTDPLGNITRYSYAVGGRLATITDPRGNVAKQIAYDGSGRVIEQKFADGGFERYAYTLSGTVVTGVTITDSLGRVETKRFNANGYVIGYTDALGQSSVIERDMTTNLPISTTGPCGCTDATRQFDARGNLTAITDRLGHTTSMEYEPVFNNVTRITDRLGRVTTFSYDARGNLTSATDALNQTTTFTYDSFGELVSITDPLRHITRVEYDSNGNVSAVIDPMGNRTTLGLDLIGRLTTMADPLNRRFSLEYDDLDRITLVTDPAGATTRFAYDPNSNLIGATDALGQQWTNEYDAKDRLVTRRDPLGRLMLMEYNTDDEATAMISPSGRTTRYTYDPRGQLVTMTDPLGGGVRFAYDHMRNLTSLTDERGNTTTFIYDELYHPIVRRDPLGRKSTASYDAVGNVIEIIDRLGRRTSYTYDALNRPNRAVYADATVDYTYDAGYRLTRIDDTQSGSIVWGYDDADRLLSETTPAGTVSYAYNAASQRHSMTAADRPPVTYDYDSAGRLKTINQGAETFTYSYDALSRLTGLQRPNGVRTTYSYDTVHRLQRLSHINSQNQFIEDFRYSYNDDDEIASITSLASAQLLSTAKAVGTADAANRLTQFGQANFSFDDEGQTTTKSDTQGTTAYQWDVRGRMTRATLPNDQAVNYGYDALGRRASRTTAGVTASFLYDDEDIVLDRSSNGSAVDYLNGPGIDDKLRQASSATGELYFLQDYLGSTLALTNVIGSVIERMQYESFGETNGSALTRYGFTGRENDPSIGLLYYRTRWYDSRQGRFVSEDSIGFSSGDTNLYKYVGNAPVNLLDPTGLVVIDAKKTQKIIDSAVESLDVFALTPVLRFAHPISGSVGAFIMFRPGGAYDIKTLNEQRYRKRERQKLPPDDLYFDVPGLGCLHANDFGNYLAAYTATSVLGDLAGPFLTRLGGHGVAVAVQIMRHEKITGDEPASKIYIRYGIDAAKRDRHRRRLFRQ